MFSVLYQDEFHRVEYHRAAGGGTNRVACTFTPFNFYTIDNEGFGVSFMLSRGYDVIAFKCINDSWFQELPPEVFADVGRVTAGYGRVVTYGSSMGGYAAITFSKRLNADSIVAISPQFSIDSPSDRRWAAQAEKIAWAYRMDPAQVSARSMYLLYDNKMPLEMRQINQIVEVAEGIESVHHLCFPLSGHPTGTFLAQAGLITNIVSEVLEERLFAAPTVGWKHMRRSSAYFLSLSQLARAAGRRELEILALRYAVRLRPDHILAQNLLQAALKSADHQ